jgi:hypothetical protein
LVVLCQETVTFGRDPALRVRCGCQQVQRPGQSRGGGFLSREQETETVIDDLVIGEGLPAVLPGALGEQMEEVAWSVT